MAGQSVPGERAEREKKPSHPKDRPSIPFPLPLPFSLWSPGVWAVSSLLIPPRGCEEGGAGCGRFLIVTGGLAAAPPKMHLPRECMVPGWAGSEGGGGDKTQDAGGTSRVEPYTLPRGHWKGYPWLPLLGGGLPLLPHRVIGGGGWKPHPQDRH